MSTLLSGTCPYCPAKLTYEEGADSVLCNFCDQLIPISELLKTKKKNGRSASADGSGFAAFTGFDNPESGVVFLENFFDTYDWETYKQLPEIEIPEIDEVIGNNKIKNGAVPETWYLDFMGLYVPVSKKFEALSDCEKVIIEKFNPVDPTEIFSAFDTYKSIASTLIEKEESILKSLNSAIKYAERFSLNAESLAEMRKNSSEIAKKFSTITTRTVETKNGSKTVVIDKIEGLKAYEVAKTTYATKSVNDYAAKGIDAPGTYKKALEEYNANNIPAALYLFEAIRNYSDSALYISKLNQYFSFFSEVYRFAGQHFIYKKSASDRALELKDAKNNNRENIESALLPTAISLYRVVDGVPEEVPTITGIRQVITCYGTKLFFFKTGQGIACYDIATGVETIIDKGDEILYQNDEGNFVCGFSGHAPTFYVRKRFAEPIKGCGGKQKGVKLNDLNPFSLLLIDMSTSACTVVVKEMTDIKLRKDDKIFFDYAYLVGGSKGCLGIGKKESECKFRLMVCDIAKGTVDSVLDDDCDICAVSGDKVVYTLWKDNDLNEDLHVYDMENGTDVLIEKNIYEFFRIIDDKIYYTIGNAQFQPLVRANFDGSEREQVMMNIRKIELIRGGWFYATKGKGFNSILIKTRIDGKDTKLICSGIDHVIRFEGNYIYYSDMFGNLRVVRIDGKDDRLIAEKVDKIFPSDEGLYYCRNEYVDDHSTNYSLYYMDKEGKNIRKIVFDVDQVKNDDITNNIYFSRTENVRFRAFKPGKENKAFYQFFNITKYFYISKEANSEPVLFLTLGLPKNEMKQGCFGKSKLDLVYVPDPIVHSYKNRGYSDREIMESEGTGTPVKDSASTPGWAKGLSETAKSGGCGCAPAN